MSARNYIATHYVITQNSAVLLLHGGSLKSRKLKCDVQESNDKILAIFVHFEGLILTRIVSLTNRVLLALKSSLTSTSDTKKIMYACPNHINAVWKEFR